MTLPKPPPATAVPPIPDHLKPFAVGVFSYTPRRRTCDLKTDGGRAMSVAEARALYDAGRAELAQVRLDETWHLQLCIPRRHPVAREDYCKLSCLRRRGDA